MNGYLAQSAIGLAVALVLTAFAVRAMRSRRLTFSLFTLWVFVAFLIGLAAPMSRLAQDLAKEAGVSPSGVVLGVSVGILLLALWRISLDVSTLRRIVATLTTHLATQVVETSAEKSDSIAVVVPAFNEATTVETVVHSVRSAGYACIVVDDGSTDATARLAGAAGATVLRHPTNLGVGAALRTGFGFAASHGYDAIVQCDADGQHPTGSIEALVRAWRSGRGDLVIGSRFASGGSYTESVSFVRRAVIRWLAGYATKVCGTTISDPTSGFRVISNDLAKVVSTELGDHYLADTFELVVRTARAGYVVSEVEVDMIGRQGGVASARGSKLALYTTRVVLVTMLHLSPALSKRSAT